MYYNVFRILRLSLKWNMAYAFSPRRKSGSSRKRTVQRRLEYGLPSLRNESEITACLRRVCKFARPVLRLLKSFPPQVQQKMMRSSARPNGEKNSKPHGLKPKTSAAMIESAASQRMMRARAPLFAAAESSASSLTASLRHTRSADRPGIGSAATTPWSAEMADRARIMGFSPPSSEISLIRIKNTSPRSMSCGGKVYSKAVSPARRAKRRSIRRPQPAAPCADSKPRPSRRPADPARAPARRALPA